MLRETENFGEILTMSVSIDSLSERVGLSASKGYMLFNSFLLIAWMVFDLVRGRLSGYKLDSDLPYYYVGIYLLNIALYVLLANVICKPELRATFSSLVLKGGLVSIAIGFVVNTSLALLHFASLHPVLDAVAWLLWAASEEVAKLATLLISVKVGGFFPKALPPGTVSVNTPREFLTLAFAVGLGFEVWENAYYYHNWLVAGMPVEVVVNGGIYRSVTKIHGIWVAISAMSLWSSTLRNGEAVKVKPFLSSVIVSTLLHFSWNKGGHIIIHAIVVACSLFILNRRLRTAETE